MTDMIAAVDRLERAAMAYERLGKLTRDDEKTRQIRKDTMAELAAARATLMAPWQPIETAPKDRPILAWCDHEADPFAADEKTGRLTLYAAHAEGMSHAPTGWHIIEWGGAWCDTGEYGAVEAEMPDWWFVVGSEFEVAANPTSWTELPPKPGAQTPA